MKVGNLYVHYIMDSGENTGGFYSEVYSDVDMTNRLDYFCVHPNDCDCRSTNDVEQYIRTYVSNEYKKEMETVEKKNIPYSKTLNYAIEYGETQDYRASYKANMACKTAISEAINKHYKDNCLDSKSALDELTEAFSLARIAIITAVSIREQDWDGRISDKNKTWAKSIPFPVDADDWNRDRNAVFRVSNVHSGLLDLFANTVRKELEIQKETPVKKDSLLEKINRPLPSALPKDKSSKEQEL